AQPERTSRVVPEDLPPARIGDRLLEHRADTPREGAVGMRIVRVPQEVVVADDVERRLHRRFVAAERDEEIRFEVFARSLGQVLVLGVAAEAPMLLHALQPVGNPSAVRLDLYDLELRISLED